MQFQFIPPQVKTLGKGVTIFLETNIVNFNIIVGDCRPSLKNK